MGVSPSVANVGNVLTAQAIEFDAELIPNLKGNTAAFVVAAQRRIQKLNSGINRSMFMYDTLSASLGQATDGAALGSPEFIGQVTTPAQLGEWSNFSNFSAMSAAAAIDELVGNSAVELGYQAGQTISELYSTTLDGAASVDTLVTSITTSNPLDLATIREMKNSLVAHNVLPCKNGMYYGQISPNVLNDVCNSTAVNNSIVDVWKHTESGLKKFDEVGSFSQEKAIEIGPGTNILFHVTPFVTKTTSGSPAVTKYRTYVEGNYSHIGIWMEVPGDTDLGDGDWRTIDCGVVNNAPSSVYDPTATIGSWAYLRFHQTCVLPSAGGVTSGTQRIRFIDSVPALV